MATNPRTRSRKLKADRNSTRTQTVCTAENLLILATNPDYQTLCCETLRKLPLRLRADIASRSAGSKIPSKARKTLIVSRLTDLSRNVVQRSNRAATTKQVVFVNDLPMEAVVDRLMALQIRSSQRLHIASNRSRASEAKLLYRLVSGLAEFDTSSAVVDAWLEGEELVLLSPAFDRMVVPCEKLTRFLGSDLSKFAEFEIDEDGSFVYWPHADVHLGWKQLQQLIDPTAAIEDIKKSKDFKERYGSAIRSLRESSGLRQTDVKGLTSRQLRRIEHGEQVVSRRALEVLAESHRIPVDEYLKRLATLAAATAKHT